MIQFNLLPDVKLEYVKAERMKHLLTLISSLVIVVAIAVLVLAIGVVDVVQKKSLHDENADIQTYSTKLKNVPNLDTMLTTQNQLNTLTGLHDQKPVVSRLFGDIAQVTPSQDSLNKLSADFTANTLTIGGTAPSLDAVSTYTDTLKATSYKIGNSSTTTPAFSSVVLADFNRNSTGASFTITLNFDPLIFNTKDDVNLSVTQGTSTSQSSVFGGGN